MDRDNLKQQKEAQVRKMEQEAQLMKHKLNEALCKVDIEIDKKKKLELDYEKLRRTADDLRTSKEKIQEQVGRTEQSRHEELIQRCKQSEDLVQQLRKNISDNKKIIASKEQSLNDILEQKNKLEDDLKNSRRNKIRVENALEQEKAKYKTQEKSFQDKSDSLKCEVARLKNETNKLLEDNKEGRERYSTLERDLTKLEFDLKSCKQKLEKKTSEHDITLKSLQDINKRKDVAKSEAMRGLENQLAKEREIRAQSEHRASDMDKKINLLEYDLQEAINSKQQALALKNKVELQLKEVVEVRNEQQNEKSKLKEEINQMKSEVRNMKTMERQLNKDLQQSSEEKQVLQKSLHKLKKERQEQESAMREQQDQLEAEQYFSSLYRTQVKELKEEKEELNKKMQEEESNMNMLRDDSEKLTDEVRKYKERCLKLENSKVVLEEKLNSSQLKNNKVELELNEFQNTREELQLLQNVKFSLEKKITNTETMLSKRNSQFEELSTSFEQLKKDHEILTKENAEIPNLKFAFENKLKQEKMLKMQAVNKLAEVMNKKDFKKQKNKVSSDVFKKKEKECRKLEAELSREKQKYNEQSLAHKQALEDLQEVCEQDATKLQELSMQIDSKDATIEDLQRQIQLLKSDVTSQNSLQNVDDNNAGVSSNSQENTLSGWLSIPNRNNIKKIGYWKSQYVIVSKRKILFYNSEVEKDNANPRMIIDLEKLFHVRPVTQAEAYRAKPQEIPTIFQILYATEGESRRRDEQNKPDTTDEEGKGTHRGHNFIPIVYHLPTNCENCTKPLWAMPMFKPPPAIECQKCHIKFHKEHLDDNTIQPCKANVYSDLDTKELLLKCSYSSNQKNWVRQLQKKIPKKPPTLNDSFTGRNSPRVASVRYNPAIRKPSSRSDKYKTIQEKS